MQQTHFNPTLISDPTHPNTTSLHETTHETVKTPLYLSKYNEDSQLSTSFSSDSSNTGSRTPSLTAHSDGKEDTRFPILIPHKLKGKSSSKKVLSAGLRDSEILDTPVAEEGEELEVEKEFLKKLPVIDDGEEFIGMKSHADRFRGREVRFNKDLNRCRSLEASFLPLDSVTEDKNEEDLNLFRQRKKLNSVKMEDLNEFNRHDRFFPPERRTERKLSMNIVSNNVIMEEQENKIMPHFVSVFASHSGNGSRRGSLLASPGPKLKVDEIDFMEQKGDAKDEDSDDDEIDIIEEIEEKNTQMEDNKEYQAAKAKLNDEIDFIKKVVKGDLIDEGETGLSQRESRDFSYVGTGVTQEIIEEENNES